MTGQDTDDRRRWDAQYAEACVAELPSTHWLESVGLPSRGRALDVASGRGALACFLALRGLEVTALDISGRALELSDQLAARCGVTLRSCNLDLASDALPEGPFALITCINYLDRKLWPKLAARLAPGGLLALEMATRTNLERHARPSARWLLEPNELSMAFAGEPTMLLTQYREAWIDDRHVARAVYRHVARAVYRREVR